MFSELGKFPPESSEGFLKNSTFSNIRKALFTEKIPDFLS